MISEAVQSEDLELLAAASIAAATLAVEEDELKSPSNSANHLCSFWIFTQVIWNLQVIILLLTLVLY